MVRYFKNKGKALAYSDMGSGDTIVLLHGYLESLLIFEKIAERLSRHFRVISTDLPGHGLSDTVSECHTMEEMADAVKVLLEYLNTGRVMMAGHSLGGYVTLAFLERYPHLLAGYSLFHSHPFADTDDAKERRYREIDIVQAGKKAIMYPANIERMYSPQNLEILRDEIELSNEIASRTPDEGIMAVLRGMIARPSRVGVFEKGEVPLLWVLGIHDQYIDYKTIIERVKLPSNARLATLFESGHLGFIEEPDRSAALINEFALSVFGSNSRA